MRDEKRRRDQRKHPITTKSTEDETPFRCDKISPHLPPTGPCDPDYPRDPIFLPHQACVTRFSPSLSSFPRVAPDFSSPLASMIRKLPHARTTSGKKGNRPLNHLPRRSRHCHHPCRRRRKSRGPAHCVPPSPVVVPVVWRDIGVQRDLTALLSPLPPAREELSRHGNRDNPGEHLRLLLPTPRG